MVATAERAEIAGLPVTVCSLDHLYAMKRAAGRPLDLLDIEALEIAHSTPGDDAS